MDQNKKLLENNALIEKAIVGILGLPRATSNSRTKQNEVDPRENQNDGKGLTRNPEASSGSSTDSSQEPVKPFDGSDQLDRKLMGDVRTDPESTEVADTFQLNESGSVFEPVTEEEISVGADMIEILVDSLSDTTEYVSTLEEGVSAIRVEDTPLPLSENCDQQTSSSPSTSNQFNVSQTEFETADEIENLNISPTFLSYCNDPNDSKTYMNDSSETIFSSEISINGSISPEMGSNQTQVEVTYEERNKPSSSSNCDSEFSTDTFIIGRLPDLQDIEDKCEEKIGGDVTKDSPNLLKSETLKTFYETNAHLIASDVEESDNSDTSIELVNKDSSDKNQDLVDNDDDTDMPKLIAATEIAPVKKIYANPPVLKPQVPASKCDLQPKPSVVGVVYPFHRATTSTKSVKFPTNTVSTQLEVNSNDIETLDDTVEIRVRTRGNKQTSFNVLVQNFPPEVQIKQEISKNFQRETFNYNTNEKTPVDENLIYSKHSRKVLENNLFFTGNAKSDENKSNFNSIHWYSVDTINNIKTNGSNSGMKVTFSSSMPELPVDDDKSEVQIFQPRSEKPQKNNCQPVQKFAGPRLRSHQRLDLSKEIPRVRTVAGRNAVKTIPTVNKLKVDIKKNVSTIKFERTGGKINNLKVGKRKDTINVQSSCSEDTNIISKPCSIKSSSNSVKKTKNTYSYNALQDSTPISKTNSLHHSLSESDLLKEHDYSATKKVFQSRDNLLDEGNIYSSNIKGTSSIEISSLSFDQLSTLNTSSEILKMENTLVEKANDTDTRSNNKRSQMKDPSCSSSFNALNTGDSPLNAFATDSSIHSYIGLEAYNDMNDLLIDFGKLFDEESPTKNITQSCPDLKQTNEVNSLSQEGRDGRQLLCTRFPHLTITPLCASNSSKKEGEINSDHNNFNSGNVSSLNEPNSFLQNLPHSIVAKQSSGLGISTYEKSNESNSSVFQSGSNENAHISQSSVDLSKNPLNVSILEDSSPSSVINVRPSELSTFQTSTPAPFSIASLIDNESPPFQVSSNSSCSSIKKDIPLPTLDSTCAEYRIPSNSSFAGSRDINGISNNNESTEKIPMSKIFENSSQLGRESALNSERSSLISPSCSSEIENVSGLQKLPSVETQLSSSKPTLVNIQKDKIVLTQSQCHENGDISVGEHSKTLLVTQVEPVQKTILKTNKDNIEAYDIQASNASSQMVEINTISICDEPSASNRTETEKSIMEVVPSIENDIQVKVVQTHFLRANNYEQSDKKSVKEQTCDDRLSTQNGTHQAKSESPTFIDDKTRNLVKKDVPKNNISKIAETNISDRAKERHLNNEFRQINHAQTTFSSDTENKQYNGNNVLEVMDCVDSSINGVEIRNQKDRAAFMVDIQQTNANDSNIVLPVNSDDKTVSKRFKDLCETKLNSKELVDEETTKFAKKTELTETYEESETPRVKGFSRNPMEMGTQTDKVSQKFVEELQTSPEKELLRISKEIVISTENQLPKIPEAQKTADEKELPRIPEDLEKSTEKELSKIPKELETSTEKELPIILEELETLTSEKETTNISHVLRMSTEKELLSIPEKLKTSTEEESPQFSKKLGVPTGNEISIIPEELVPLTVKEFTKTSEEIRTDTENELPIPEEFETSTEKEIVRIPEALNMTTEKKSRMIPQELETSTEEKSPKIREKLEASTGNEISIPEELETSAEKKIIISEDLGTSLAKEMPRMPEELEISTEKEIVRISEALEMSTEKKSPIIHEELGKSTRNEKAVILELETSTGKEIPRITEELEMPRISEEVEKSTEKEIVRIPEGLKISTEKEIVNIPEALIMFTEKESPVIPDKLESSTEEKSPKIPEKLEATTENEISIIPEELETLTIKAFPITSEEMGTYTENELPIPEQPSTGKEISRIFEELETLPEKGMPSIPEEAGTSTEKVIVKIPEALEMSTEKESSLIPEELETSHEKEITRKPETSIKKKLPKIPDELGVSISKKEVPKLPEKLLTSNSNKIISSIPTPVEELGPTIDKEIPRAPEVLETSTTMKLITMSEELGTLSEKETPRIDAITESCDISINKTDFIDSTITLIDVKMAQLKDNVEINTDKKQVDAGDITKDPRLSIAQEDIHEIGIASINSSSLSVEETMQNHQTVENIQTFMDNSMLPVCKTSSLEEDDAKNINKYVSKPENKEVLENCKNETEELMTSIVDENLEKNALSSEGNSSIEVVPQKRKVHKRGFSVKKSLKKQVKSKNKKQIKGESKLVAELKNKMHKSFVVNEMEEMKKGQHANEANICQGEMALLKDSDKESLFSEEECSIGDECREGLTASNSKAVSCVESPGPSKLNFHTLPESVTDFNLKLHSQANKEAIPTIRNIVRRNKSPSNDCLTSGKDNVQKSAVDVNVNKQVLPTATKADKPIPALVNIKDFVNLNIKEGLSAINNHSSIKETSNSSFVKGIQKFIRNSGDIVCKIYKDGAKSKSQNDMKPIFNPPPKDKPIPKISKIVRGNKCLSFPQEDCINQSNISLDPEKSNSIKPQLRKKNHIAPTKSVPLKVQCLDKSLVEGSMKTNVTPSNLNENIINSSLPSKAVVELMYGNLSSDELKVIPIKNKTSFSSDKLDKIDRLSITTTQSLPKEPTTPVFLPHPSSSKTENDICSKYLDKIVPNLTSLKESAVTSIEPNILAKEAEGKAALPTEAKLGEKLPVETTSRSTNLSPSFENSFAVSSKGREFGELKDKVNSSVNEKGFSTNGKISIAGSSKLALEILNPSKKNDLSPSNEKLKKESITPARFLRSRTFAERTNIQRVFPPEECSKKEDKPISILSIQVASLENGSPKVSTLLCSEKGTSFELHSLLSSTQQPCSTTDVNISQLDKNFVSDETPVKYNNFKGESGSEKAVSRRESLGVSDSGSRSLLSTINEQTSTSTLDQSVSSVNNIHDSKSKLVNSLKECEALNSELLHLGYSVRSKNAQIKKSAIVVGNNLLVSNISRFRRKNAHPQRRVRISRKVDWFQNRTSDPSEILRNSNVNKQLQNYTELRSQKIGETSRNQLESLLNSNSKRDILEKDNISLTPSFQAFKDTNGINEQVTLPAIQGGSSQNDAQLLATNISNEFPKQLNQLTCVHTDMETVKGLFAEKSLSESSIEMTERLPKSIVEKEDLIDGFTNSSLDNNLKSRVDDIGNVLTETANEQNFQSSKTHLQENMSSTKDEQIKSQPLDNIEDKSIVAGNGNIENNKTDVSVCSISLTKKIIHESVEHNLTCSTLETHSVGPSFGISNSKEVKTALGSQSSVIKNSKNVPLKPISHSDVTTEININVGDKSKSHLLMKSQDILNNQQPIQINTSTDKALTSVTTENYIPLDHNCPSDNLIMESVPSIHKSVHLSYQPDPSQSVNSQHSTETEEKASMEVDQELNSSLGHMHKSQADLKSIRKQEAFTEDVSLSVEHVECKDAQHASSEKRTCSDVEQLPLSLAKNPALTSEQSSGTVLTENGATAITTHEQLSLHLMDTQKLNDIEKTEGAGSIHLAREPFENIFTKQSPETDKNSEANIKCKDSQITTKPLKQEMCSQLESSISVINPQFSEMETEAPAVDFSVQNSEVDPGTEDMESVISEVVTTMPPSQPCSQLEPLLSMHIQNVCDSEMTKNKSPPNQEPSSLLKSSNYVNKHLHCEMENTKSTTSIAQEPSSITDKSVHTKTEQAKDTTDAESLIHVPPENTSEAFINDLVLETSKFEDMKTLPSVPVLSSQMEPSHSMNSQCLSKTGTNSHLNQEQTMIVSEANFADCKVNSQLSTCTLAEDARTIPPTLVLSFQPKPSELLNTDQPEADSSEDANKVPSNSQHPADTTDTEPLLPASPENNPQVVINDPVPDIYKIECRKILPPSTELSSQLEPSLAVNSPSLSGTGVSNGHMDEEQLCSLHVAMPKSDLVDTDVNNQLSTCSMTEDATTISPVQVHSSQPIPSELLNTNQSEANASEEVTPMFVSQEPPSIKETLKSSNTGHPSDTTDSDLLIHVSLQNNSENVISNNIKDVGTRSPTPEQSSQTKPSLSLNTQLLSETFVIEDLTSKHLDKKPPMALYKTEFADSDVNDQLSTCTIIKDIRTIPSAPVHLSLPSVNTVQPEADTLENVNSMCILPEQELPSIKEPLKRPNFKEPSDTICTETTIYVSQENTSDAAIRDLTSETKTSEDVKTFPSASGQSLHMESLLSENTQLLLETEVTEELTDKYMEGNSEFSEFQNAKDLKIILPAEEPSSKLDSLECVNSIQTSSSVVPGKTFESVISNLPAEPLFDEKSCNVVSPCSEGNMNSEPSFVPNSKDSMNNNMSINESKEVPVFNDPVTHDSNFLAEITSYNYPVKCYKPKYAPRKSRPKPGFEQNKIQTKGSEKININAEKKLPQIENGVTKINKLCSLHESSFNGKIGSTRRIKSKRKIVSETHEPSSHSTSCSKRRKINLEEPLNVKSSRKVYQDSNQANEAKENLESETSFVNTKEAFKKEIRAKEYNKTNKKLFKRRCLDSKSEEPPVKRSLRSNLNRRKLEENCPSNCEIPQSVIKNVSIVKGTNESKESDLTKSFKEKNISSVSMKTKDFTIRLPNANSKAYIRKLMKKCGVRIAYIPSSSFNEMSPNDTRSPKVGNYRAIYCRKSYGREGKGSAASYDSSESDEEELQRYIIQKRKNRALRIERANISKHKNSLPPSQGSIESASKNNSTKDISNKNKPAIQIDGNQDISSRYAVSSKLKPKSDNNLRMNDKANLDFSNSVPNKISNRCSKEVVESITSRNPYKQTSNGNRTKIITSERLKTDRPAKRKQEPSIISTKMSKSISNSSKTERGVDPIRGIIDLSHLPCKIMNSCMSSPKELPNPSLLRMNRSEVLNKRNSYDITFNQFLDDNDSGEESESLLAFLPCLRHTITTEIKGESFIGHCNCANDGTSQLYYNNYCKKLRLLGTTSPKIFPSRLSQVNRAPPYGFTNVSRKICPDPDSETSDTDSDISDGSPSTYESQLNSPSKNHEERKKEANCESGQCGKRCDAECLLRWIRKSRPFPPRDLFPEEDEAALDLAEEVEIVMAVEEEEEQGLCPDPSQPGPSGLCRNLPGPPPPQDPNVCTGRATCRCYDCQESSDEDKGR